MPKRARLGVLKQDHFQYETTPILAVAMMGDRAVWEAMTEKEEILARAEESFAADRYAELEELILRHDGYALEARAGEVLEGLGIPTEVHRQPLSTLSGGFKLRVLLAQVLAAQPDVLLLDEPTNHLDIVSIRWLEKFLTAFPGTAIVISHDHRFLDNVCTHIADVDYETITLYPGDYTHFATAKRAERERRQKEIAQREKQIADHQAFVDRFRYKATKARQAQSKAKLIEKMTDQLEPLAAVVAPLPHLQVPSGAPQRQAGAGARRDLQVVRRQAGAHRRLADPPARRPAGGHRPQRHRQVDPAQDRHRRGRTPTPAPSSGATRRAPATSPRTTATSSTTASRAGRRWRAGCGRPVPPSRSASCAASSG